MFVSRLIVSPFSTAVWRAIFFTQGRDITKSVGRVIFSSLFGRLYSPQRKKTVSWEGDILDRGKSDEEYVISEGCTLQREKIEIISFRRVVTVGQKELEVSLYSRNRLLRD